MEVIEEELKFEDNSDIIQNRGTIKERQALMRRRTNSKNPCNLFELLRRVDIAEVRTPSIEQRSKIQQTEQILFECLKKESSSRTDDENSTLSEFLNSTTSFKRLRIEYDDKTAKQFMRLLCVGIHKPEEDIIKYSKFLSLFLESTNDNYYYIVSGIVSIMAPIRVVRAFQTEGDYQEYKKKHSTLEIFLHNTA